MSEFLAEARILVRPDTTKFRAELEAALAVATAKPITIPIVPVVAGGGIASATAATGALAAANGEAAASTEVMASALQTEAVAAAQTTGANTAAAEATAALSVAQKGAAESAAALAVSQAAAARTTAGVSKGIIAQGASLLGLRAGTLAASSAFIAGTVAVLAFGKAVQSAASLETELNVFRVTAGATADEMERVSAEARALGKDLTLPGVNANDAAVALTELSKAGLSVEDSLAGARGALQLATAAQIDNVAATKLIAGALNAFNLSGTEAVHVADLLTGAAKESQGEITDMGTALGQVAAVSKQFGVTLPDTVTLLTELAQAGLSGGRAGTSLRVAFLRLVNPTAAAAKELDKLNIAVRDANGNLKPTVFLDIADALQSYTKAQRDAALATIFGSDAIRAAAIIGNKGALAFLRTSAAINEAGLAQEQAAARTSGLQGATENLKNQVSALGLEIGKVTTGPLKGFVDGLASVAQNATLTVEGLVKVGKALDDVSKKGEPPVKLSDRIAGGIENIGKKSLIFLSPVATLFALSAAEMKVLGAAIDKAAPPTDKLGDSVDGVSSSLSDLSRNLLQSAADSKAFTEQVTTDTANLLQSAADSRVDLNKLGSQTQAHAQFPVARIQNIVQGFETKQVTDQINHDNQQLLADLQAERSFLIGELQKQGVKNRPALFRALNSALGGVVSQIDQIQAKAASDLKAAAAERKRQADAAAKAVSDANRAVLDAFSLSREQRQNAIDVDAVKGNLAKQIKDENALATLVKNQIAAIKVRITGAKDQATALAALKAVQNLVAAAQKALLKQQADALQQQRANAVERAQLDVEFAQITGTEGHRQAEIEARKVLIKRLQAEQKLTQAGTIAYKQLRNEIATQNKAIADLNAEKKKQNSALASAEFEFLQAQQGFASNLLGNLIPGFATGGLVGGGAPSSGSPLIAALAPLAASADAKSQSGVTAGQGNATNNLLARILQELKAINGQQQAPEAWKQVKSQHAIFDGVGGG